MKIKINVNGRYCYHYAHIIVSSNIYLKGLKYYVTPSNKMAVSSETAILTQVKQSRTKICFLSSDYNTVLSNIFYFPAVLEKHTVGTVHSICLESFLYAAGDAYVHCSVKRPRRNWQPRTRVLWVRLFLFVCENLFHSDSW